MINPNQSTQLPDIFVARVDEILAKHLFRKDKYYWRRISPQTITVIYLQKSSWGSSFYFNIGVYIKELEHPYKNRPGMGDMHASARLEEIAKLNAGTGLPVSLDGPEDKNAMMIEKTIRALIDIGIPIVEQLGTLDGVKAVLNSCPEFKVQLQASLKERLHIS